MRSINGGILGGLFGMVIASSVGAVAQAEPQQVDEAGEVEEAQGVEEPAELDDPAPVPAATADAPKKQAAENPIAPTSHATLRFRNDVSDKYTLVEVRFQMDGKALSPLNYPERGKGYVVFAGPAPAGRHVVTAHLTYQGRSRGIFTYTKGYTFKVTADQVLTTPANRNVGFTVVGKELKGLDAPAAGRITVTVEENAGGSKS